MAHLGLAFLAGLALALLAFPLAAPILARRRVPDDAAALLLAVIWPLSRLASPGTWGGLETALCATLALLLAASLPPPPWRRLALALGWTGAAAVALWHDLGTDLEPLRGSLGNAGLTLLYFWVVGASVEAAQAREPSRLSGALALLALAAATFPLLTGQETAAAAALPVAGIALSLHLHLVPPPEVACGRAALPPIAGMLTLLVLAVRWSDRGRAGAIAAPLLWAVPAAALLQAGASRLGLGCRAPSPGVELGLGLALTVLLLAASAAAGTIALALAGGGILLSLILILLPWLPGKEKTV